MALRFKIREKEKEKPEPKYCALTEKEARVIRRAETGQGRKTHAVKRKDGLYDIYNTD